MSVDKLVEQRPEGSIDRMGGTIQATSQQTNKYDPKTGPVKISQILASIGSYCSSSGCTPTSKWRKSQNTDSRHRVSVLALFRLVVVSAGIS
jgi:hypothetical protein